MKPTTNQVNDALESIARTERPANHPRNLARQAIEQWRSNAQLEGLPTTNLHDDKGADLLDRDGVLRASYPTYTATVVKRSLWARLWRR